MNSTWQRLVAALACTSAMGAHAATYQLDEFSLTSYSTTAFTDSFDDGIAPSTGITYQVAAPFASGAEAAGKLGLNAAQGVGFGSGRVQYAAPSTYLFGPVFSVTGRFDFVTPQAGEAYFVRLDDLYFGSGGILAKSYSVAVNQVGGQAFATLASLDAMTGTVSKLYTSGPLSGSGQITLAFAAGSDGIVHASYQLSGSAAPVEIGTLNPVSNHYLFGGAFGSYADPVPEPDSVALMALGLLVVLTGARRRRRR